MERAKKEIFSSQIFDKLKEQHSDFMAFIDEKIVPVEGDIAVPQLIFNEEKLRDIIENVNVIINNAASIDFNLRLDQSIQINYFGPLRLLALAKKCKNAEVFTHVSTCYVNSDKQYIHRNCSLLCRGYIDEKIYDYPEDPDDIINQLQQIPEQEMLATTKKLIAPWHNTYTFTKNLAERALQKHRESFPILILRPAIIICAYQQPYPGWLDSLAAAGAISMLISSGAVHYFASNNHTRGDIIPVDFVSNAILIGTAFQANQDSLAIQHCGSSHTNPVTWKRYSDHILDYSRKQPMEQRLGSLRLKLVSEKTFLRMFYLEHTLPALVMTKLSNYVGTKQFKKNVQRLNKLNDKILQIHELLKDFTLNDWCYETKRIVDLLDRLDPEERMDFNCDPRTIDWTLGSCLNVYGIQKFMMKMDVYLPNEQNNLIQKVNSRCFEDTTNFLAKANKVKSKNLDDLIDTVLFSNRVQSEMKMLTHGLGNHNGNYQMLMKEGKDFLKSLSSQIDRKTLQSVFVVFHQRFKKIFDQIVVSDADLKQISHLTQQKGKSVVLIPSFKSYLDFVLLLYIHIIYEIELPFISGLVQFSDIAIVTKLLKRCGGFFVDQKKLNKPLFKVVFEEFITQLLKKQHILGYHIERRRERSGKIVKPLQFIFEYIVDSYLRNVDEVEDLVLVPVTINYDKIYEGQQFPFELLGDESKRESVLKMLRSIFWVNEQYGRVHVKYCKPISLKEKIVEYVTMNNVDAKFIFTKEVELLNTQQQQALQNLKNDFSEHLSMELVYTLSDNLVIMSTNMVAAVLIQKRQGGITEEELVRKVSWLYDEILVRGGNTSVNTRPTKSSIRNALNYLKNFIDTKRDVLSPQVKANKDYKNYLMLAYYRNNLIHLFLNECYIAASLLAFGESTTAAQGVSLQRLWEQTEFLISILRDEFIVRDQISDWESFSNVLRFMERRGYIEVLEGPQPAVKLTKHGKFPLRFFSSLILPFVESYWVTLSFLKQMKPQQQHLQYDMEQRVQWLAETLYDEGFLIYYDSCSLEPIGNAVQRFSTLGLLIRKGQPYSIQNQQPEVYFQMGDDTDRVKEIYERLTFFKPTLTLITQILNFEDDVQRILAKTPSRHMAKL